MSGGTFLLIGTDVIGKKADFSLLLPIGVFGALVTLGLFIYEIYAAKRCTELINVGKDLERNLGIKGQFITRPRGIEGFPFILKFIAPYVSEPLASGIIYPGVLGAWVFLALHKWNVIAAGISAISLVIVLVSVSFAFNRWLDPNEESQKNTGKQEGSV